MRPQSDLLQFSFFRIHFCSICVENKFLERMGCYRRPRTIEQTCVSLNLPLGVFFVAFAEQEVNIVLLEYGRTLS